MIGGYMATREIDWARGGSTRTMHAWGREGDGEEEREKKKDSRL
jgi:hypothetical protein